MVIKIVNAVLIILHGIVNILVLMIHIFLKKNTLGFQS
jgi:hypothetical protein